MKLIFKDGVFTAKIPFSERHKISRMGFIWIDETKSWQTRDKKIAARLRAFADENAEKELSKLFIKINPWPSPIKSACDFALKESQEIAVKFALSRSSAYLGLDPGMGKGAVASTVHNELYQKAKKETKKHKSVFISPPFLVSNLRKEIELWTANFGHVSTLNEPHGDDVLILPDSKIHTVDAIRLVKSFLDGSHTASLFGDEGHRFKEETSRRSKYFYKKLCPLFTQKYLMSGTPMPSRPIELFAPLTNLAPETIDFKNRHNFGLRYCDGFLQEGWGWNFNGESNLIELREKMKPFLLRMRKEEWLKELPPKSREVVFIGDNLSPKIAPMDKAIMRSLSPRDLMRKNLADKYEYEKLHIATYRKLLGLEKLESSIEFIKYELEKTLKPMLLFAWHPEVIQGLANELKEYEPTVISSNVPVAKRSALADSFQNGKGQVAILNIQGAIGYTITKAARGIFVESDWTPGGNTQAEDRMHRIGQEFHVRLQYLVFRNSIDRKVIEDNLSKMEIEKNVA